MPVELAGYDVDKLLAQAGGDPNKEAQIMDWSAPKAEKAKAEKKAKAGGDPNKEAQIMDWSAPKAEKEIQKTMPKPGKVTRLPYRALQMYGPEGIAAIKKLVEEDGGTFILEPDPDQPPEITAKGAMAAEGTLEDPLEQYRQMLARQQLAGAGVGVGGKVLAASAGSAPIDVETLKRLAKETGLPSDEILRQLGQGYQLPEDIAESRRQMAEQYGENVPLDFQQESLKNEYQRLAVKPNKTLAETTRMQQLALELHGVTQTRKAEEEKTIREGIERDITLDETQMRELQQQRRNMLGNQMAEIRDAMVKLENTKIDPQRYYKKLGKGRAIIAMLLGAIGQALQRHAGHKTAENMVLVAMDAAVQRDIAAQKAEIAKQGGILNAKMGLYGMLRSKFHDDITAQKLNRMYILEGAKRQMETLAAEYKGQEIADRAMIGRAALLKQQQKDMMDILQRRDTLTLQNRAIQQRAAGATRSWSKRWALSAGGGAGGGGKPPSKTQLDALTELRASLDKMNMIWHDWEGYTKKRGDNVLNTGGATIAQYVGGTDAKLWDNRANMLAKYLTRAIEGARPTDWDFKIYLTKGTPMANDFKVTGQKKMAANYEHQISRLDATLSTLVNSGIDISGFIADPKTQKIIQQARTYMGIGQRAEAPL